MSLVTSLTAGTTAGDEHAASGALLDGPSRIWLPPARDEADVSPRYLTEPTDSGEAAAQKLVYVNPAAGWPQGRLNDTIVVQTDVVIDGTPVSAGTVLRANEDTAGGDAAAWSGWASSAAAGIATVASQAELLALPLASLVDGDARSEGRTTYVWHAAMTPEQADGLPTLEPTDKPAPGVDSGYWVQQVPELSASFGDFRTSRTTIHTFGDSSSIERVRFIASDQNYSTRKSLLQELEFDHFTQGGNGWVQVNGGATDADGFVSIEKQFELASGRHYRVEIFTRFNPDDATAIDWRVESQYSYNVDVLNNIRAHDRLTIVDFEIIRSGAAGIGVNAAVLQDGPVLWDKANNEFVAAPAVVSGPAVERIVYNRNRDSTMTFGDLQFRAPSWPASSLQFRMGSGSTVINNLTVTWSNQQGGASEQTVNFVLGTTWTYFRQNGQNLTQHNNYQQGVFVCNGWLYRCEVLVGNGWNNNKFAFTRWRIDAVKGDPGNDGADAASIDHISQTAGDSSPGTTDTYTLWADAGETNALGTYDVPIPAVPAGDYLIQRGSLAATSNILTVNFPQAFATTPTFIPTLLINSSSTGVATADVWSVGTTSARVILKGDWRSNDSVHWTATGEA